MKIPPSQLGECCKSSDKLTLLGTHEEFVLEPEEIALEYVFVPTVELYLNDEGVFVTLSSEDAMRII